MSVRLRPRHATLRPNFAPLAPFLQQLTTSFYSHPREFLVAGRLRAGQEVWAAIRVSRACAAWRINTSRLARGTDCEEGAEARWWDRGQERGGKWSLTRHPAPWCSLSFEQRALKALKNGQLFRIGSVGGAAGQVADDFRMCTGCGARGHFDDACVQVMSKQH